MGEFVFFTSLLSFHLGFPNHQPLDEPVEPSPQSSPLISPDKKRIKGPHLHAEDDNEVRGCHRQSFGPALGKPHKPLVTAFSADGELHADGEPAAVGKSNKLQSLFRCGGAYSKA
jgi:hypothetical protein